MNDNGCGGCARYGCLGALTGMVPGVASWTAAALAVGLTRLPRRRASATWRSGAVTAATVLVALAPPAWARFSFFATVPFPGAPSNSGRCGNDNVPGRWPGWLPAGSGRE